MCSLANFYIKYFFAKKLRFDKIPESKKLFMKNLLKNLLAFFFVCSFSQLFSETEDLLKDNVTVIIQELQTHRVLLQKGDIDKRKSPCSTFKIALSLMGYDSEILFDETSPTISYDPKVETKFDLWKKPHDPLSWIKNSCIWFSREITSRLGMEKFQKYVTSFEYGNQDLSGDEGLNNGLTHSWLSSSLKISPKEQVCFLEKLLEGTLPVSSHAHEMTKSILFSQKLTNEWELFGKQGTGHLTSKNGNNFHAIGWFVGWAKTPSGTIIICLLLKNEKESATSAGSKAKELAKELLLKVNI